MNTIKHQCPSCGGSLTVSNDRMMYCCTSCGSTYDYEYFREEQMHDMGGTYLSRGEFMAAADAYNFILKNDPHDFFALRGLLLASAHLKNINELAREDKRNGFAYKPELFKESIENAAEEDKEYFKKFSRIFSDKKSLYDLNHEISSVREEKRKILTAVNLDKEERTYYYTKDKRGQMKDPRITFYPLLICGGLMFISGLPFLIIQAQLGSDGVTSALKWFSFIVGGIITGCDLIFIYPKVREIREIDQHCEKLEAEAAQVEMRIKRLEHEAEELSDDIRTSIHDFVEKDTQIMLKKMTSEA